MSDKHLDEDVYKFQPVLHDGSINEMMLDGEECNRVLMGAMGDKWEQVDVGGGHILSQINKNDVQAVSWRV